MTALDSGSCPGIAGTDNGEFWANDTADIKFVVTAIPDGSGDFVVTQYTNGTFVAIVGRHYPGNTVAAQTCGEGQNVFHTATNGTFYGVWTQVLHGGVYNPYATFSLPPGCGAGCAWNVFRDAVFNGGTHVHDTYQFNYKDSCGDLWRDTDRADSPSDGNILDCPRVTGS
jgi:hypothetical protein